MEKPQRAAFFLRSTPALEALRTGVREQEKLAVLVRSLLPSDLAPHCLYVQGQDGQLLIYTDSSAWASRLRFYSRDLLARLKAANLPVRKVVVRVRLDQPERVRPPRPARPLSLDNAALLAAVADGIDDPALAAALRRLGRRGLG